MQHILIANPKGGSGKTTVAAQVAGYFAAHECAVTLVDHDPQRSALDWLKERPVRCPAIAGVAAFAGEPLPVAGDVAVHDLPAGVKVEQLLALAQPGARLVIPFLPSATDIRAGVRFLLALHRHEHLLASGLRCALVANRVRKNTTYAKVLLEFLATVNFPLVAEVRETQNYVRAMAGGLSLYELPPARVREDLASWQSLWRWLEA